MKELHRRARRQADEPDGPGQPDDVGRGAESGLVHEGQDRPALVLRPGRAGPATRPSRSSTARPAAATTSSRPTAARTPSTSSSAWAATWRRPRRRSTTCATKGIAAGCLNIFCFRPFPPRQIVDALKNCTAFTVFERMDDPLSTTGNHLTREIKAAFCDADRGPERPREDRPRAADLQRRRRPGQPRRAARRHHRHRSTT